MEAINEQRKTNEMSAHRARITLSEGKHHNNNNTANKEAKPKTRETKQKSKH